MSRSRKHRPTSVYCGNSQRAFKRLGNRMVRRATHMLLERGESDVFPTLREKMNVYSMPQDGTRHYTPGSGYEWYRHALAK